MPPKKKGAAKKAAPAELKESNVENELKETERKALAEEAQRLYALTKREESAYNEFQQQREKINYFWIVEKKRLEDKKAELMNKERELQDLIEKHQVEIKVYKQRVKHLLHEHQDEITKLKTEAESGLKLSQDDHRELEQELKEDRRSLKLDLKEMEISHEDLIRTLKAENDRTITLSRQEFERNTREILIRYEKRAKTVRDELEASRKVEIQRIEDKKNNHILQIMKAHEQAFADIKAYYNDITHNNLDLIKSLKEEVSEMKKKETQDEKRMYEVAQENKRMSEPLQRALNDVDRLKKDLLKYNSDKDELNSTKADILILHEDLRELAWEHEVLQQRFDLLTKERNDLQQRFQSTVYDVQRKAGFKNLLLEKKLHAMNEELEYRELQLSEALVKANLEAPMIGSIKQRLDELLTTKNQKAHYIGQEIKRVSALHNQMVASFERLLSSKGIPVQELGFEPTVLRPPELV